MLPEAEADLNAWYDQEHLPGLAAVPGTVRALRYECRHKAALPGLLRPAHARPRQPAVAGGAATDWSSRVRPSFRNTRRTMFARIL